MAGRDDSSEWHAAHAGRLTGMLGMCWNLCKWGNAAGPRTTYTSSTMQQPTLTFTITLTLTLTCTYSKSSTCHTWWVDLLTS